MLAYPALLTKTSRRPNSRTAVWTAAVAAPGSVTSRVTARTRPPWFSARSFSEPVLRAVATRLSPASSTASASRRPKPRELPVIIQVLVMSWSLPGCGSPGPGRSGEPAAVDGEVGAGDVAGLVGEQEADRGRDLLWQAGPAHRDRPGELGGVAVAGVEHRGRDDTRLQLVDPDAVLAVVDGSRPGQAADAVLGRGVPGAGQLAAVGENARHVHDRAAPGLEHRRHLVVHAVEQAGQVDADDVVPGIDGHLVRDRGGPGDPRVVDREVQPAELADGLLDRV